MNRRIIRQFIVLLVLIAAQPFIWRIVRTHADDLHNRQTQEEQLANLAMRVESIAADVGKKQAKISQLDLVFPLDDAVPQLLERFEGLGAQSGVEVSIQGIREENQLIDKGGETIVPFSLQASAQGSIVGLLRYMEAIEHIPELVTIQQWTIAPVLGGESVITAHQINFIALFYLQRDGQQPAGETKEER